jgi:hypothetical protein
MAMAQVRDRIAAALLVVVSMRLALPFWQWGAGHVIIAVSAACLVASLLSDASFVHAAMLACVGAGAANFLLGQPATNMWVAPQSLMVFVLCLACCSFMPLDLQATIRPATAFVCGVGSVFFRPVIDFIMLTWDDPPIYHPLLLIAAAPILVSVVSPKSWTTRRGAGALYVLLEPYGITFLVWVLIIPFFKNRGFALPWLLIQFWLWLCVPATCAWLVTTLPRLVRASLEGLHPVPGGER